MKRDSQKFENVLQTTNDINHTKLSEVNWKEDKICSIMTKIRQLDVNFENLS